jgi:8-oxo-dGTP diphosphatase
MSRGGNRTAAACGKTVGVNGLKRTAVLCIVRHGDHFLMLRREREPNRGLYVPVGGKIDAHESPRAAAIREAREEAAIHVGDVRLLGSLVETSPTDYNWWTAVYLADVDERPPLVACKEGELGWFTRDELHALPMPETDRHIYAYAERGVPFAFSAEYDAELRLLRMDEELAGVRIV